MVKLNPIKKIDKTECIDQCYAFIDAENHLYIVGSKYAHKLPIIDISNSSQYTYMIEDTATIEDFEVETMIEITKVYYGYDDFELAFSEK